MQMSFYKNYTFYLPVLQLFYNFVKLRLGMFIVAQMLIIHFIRICEKYSKR